MSTFELEDVDPELLIATFAFLARRAASDLVIAHRVAKALGYSTTWFVDMATHLADMAHEFDPNHEETP